MLGQGRNTVLALVILLSAKKNASRNGRINAKQKFALIVAKIFSLRNFLEGKFTAHMTVKFAPYTEGMTRKIAALANINKNSKL